MCDTCRFPRSSSARRPGLGSRLSAPQAADNGGSGPDGRDFCEDTGNRFESDVNKADAAFNAGDMQAFNDAMDAAQLDYDAAHAMGCGWAARTRSPTRAIAVVKTGTNVQLRTVP